jgi:hypothetical protein
MRPPPPSSSGQARVNASCSPDARSDIGRWEDLHCGICRYKILCRVALRTSSWDVRIFSAFAASSHFSGLGPCQTGLPSETHRLMKTPQDPYRGPYLFLTMPEAPRMLP